MYRVLILSLLLLSVPSLCFAGGCLPGEPCDQPVAAEPEAPMPVVPAKKEMKEEKCGWGNRFAAGVPVWMFQEEDTEVGGGLYFDLYPCSFPMNLRVGAEVAHIGADQPNALNSAEFPGKNVRVTFVRIPFAVEYAVPLAERTNFFIGGGPDIIHTANDISDTSVGLHLSGRILHNFNDHLGVALEAGYMWGEVDEGGGDIDLDNTFIIPTLSYTF